MGYSPQSTSLSLRNRGSTIAWSVSPEKAGKGSNHSLDSAEKPPLFMRKTPSPKKASSDCGNVQPTANSARLRGITISDDENHECRLRRGFFSRIQAMV